MVLRAIYAGATTDWTGLDLTMPQLKVLLALAAAGPVSIGTLARELRVEQGHVERREDSSDRRRTIASLSPAAAALVARLREGSREVMEGWMRRMDRADLERLARGLAALAEASGRAESETTAGPAGGWRT